MKRFLIVIALVILAVSFVKVVSAKNDNDNQCNRNNPENCPSPVAICDNGEHTGNPHCQSPTPSASPTATPEPTATPSAVPTLEPTQAPYDGGDGLNDGLGCGQHDCNTTPRNPVSPYDGQPVGWK